MMHDPKKEKTYFEGWNGKVFCDESALEIPLHWKKPRHIFVCSMSDLFNEKVPFDFIGKIFAVIALCPQHQFQLLSKRPEIMKKYFENCLQSTTIPRIDSVKSESLASSGQQASQNKIERGRCFENTRNAIGGNDGQRHSGAIPNEPESGISHLHTSDLEAHIKWPLPNVILGVTVENQEMADKRIPILLQIPAAKRFVSCEPLLGEINLHKISHPKGGYFDSLSKKGGIAFTEGIGLDWVIVGPET
jgi:hypothetical protein